MCGVCDRIGVGLLGLKVANCFFISLHPSVIIGDCGRACAAAHCLTPSWRWRHSPRLDRGAAHGGGATPTRRQQATERRSLCSARPLPPVVGGGAGRDYGCGCGGGGCYCSPPYFPHPPPCCPLRSTQKQMKK